MYIIKIKVNYLYDKYMLMYFMYFEGSLLTLITIAILNFSDDNRTYGCLVFRRLRGSTGIRYNL